MEHPFKRIALFDFDGVIVDTEPLYDLYWNEAGERYHTGIPHFASHIKGTTMPYILEKYFSDRSEDFRQQIVRESEAFEQQMADYRGLRRKSAKHEPGSYLLHGGNLHCLFFPEHGRTNGL